MPPKKKTSSKKEKETEVDKKQWVDRGRKDAKGLSKALPETAQALKSGEIGVDEAAMQLATIGLKDHFERGRTLPIKGRPNEQVDWIEAVVAALGQTVIPVSAATEMLACELCTDFWGTLHGKTVIQSSGNELQEVFDEVAERWESRVQSLTGRPLKETCPLYKASPEAFNKFVGQYVEGNFDTAKLKDMEFENTKVEAKYVMVKRAAQGVADGDDVIKSTCWECGKQEVADIRKCSRCKAAQYCGRDCQLKSWKEGHNKACHELKITYEGLKDDEEQVFRAIEEGVEGIQPNPKYDFNLIIILMADKTRTMLGFPPNLLERFPRPSMDNFYRSLSSIIQGDDHWLFPDTPNPRFASGSYKKGRIPQLVKKEFVCSPIICFILSYDTSDATPYAVQWFRTFSLKYVVSCMGSSNGMTAKRFLQIYSTMGNHIDNTKMTAKEAKFDYKVRALKELREKHHKKE